MARTHTVLFEIFQWLPIYRLPLEEKQGSAVTYSFLIEVLKLTPDEGTLCLPGGRIYLCDHVFHDCDGLLNQGSILMVRGCL